MKEIRPKKPGRYLSPIQDDKSGIWNSRLKPIYQGEDVSLITNNKTSFTDALTVLKISECSNVESITSVLQIFLSFPNHGMKIKSMCCPKTIKPQDQTLSKR